MAINNGQYWLKYSSENIQKFEKSMENIANYERTFWTSLMTIQATLLGISMALSQYLQIPINIFLRITWILLILSIGCGIIIFKCSLDKESRSAIGKFNFSMDMSEFNLKDERSDFLDEEEKIGMFTAALIKLNPEFGESFTPYAKQLAKKYKSQLPSEKLFKDIKYSKPITFYKRIKKKLDDNINVLMTIFYSTSFGAFLTLLISIFA